MLIAIDPGKSGAIAHLHDDGRFCCVESMPVVGKMVDAAGLASALRTLVDASRRYAVPSTTRIILEQVGAMPGQGVTSMFSFGTSFGIVLGVVAALRLPLELVRPNIWKRDMGLGKDKEASRLKGLQLFPDASEMLKRKKDEGRAEAILLGLWFARRLQVQHDSSSTEVA
jgi:crossover junction endodeoxyribonuclease RuvC